jgi:hypothetical protein
MKKILFVLLVVLLLHAPQEAAAQTRRRATPAPARPATAAAPRKLVETVKTKDGREIHLYDDMTYDVAAAVEPPAPEKVEIRIKAGVITQGGDVKPVARTTFTLFKGDIKPILATLTGRDGKTMDVFGFYMADEYRALDNGQAYAAAMEKLKPNIVGSFTTDFEGNVAIEVPRSDEPHFIYGSFKVGRSSCMWYLQLTPDKGGSIMLDNNNASFCG